MRKYLRRSVSLILAVVMIFALAACGGKAEAPATSSSSASTSGVVAKDANTNVADPVTITFWHTWTADWEKTINDAVAVFEQQNPGIKVDALPVPGVSNEKFMAAVAGGDAPDVFKTNGRYAAWAFNDSIMPLDDYIAKNAPDIMKWMYPSVAESCKVNGKVYGIPMSMDTFMLWYNKTLLEKEGIDPKNLPKTLEEFDQLQQKLWKYDSKGNISQVGFYPKNSDYMCWMAQFGAKPFVNGKMNVLDDKVIKTMKWYESYTTKLKIDPMKVTAFTQANDGGDDSNSLYAKGLCAFWVDGMWVKEVTEEFAPQFEYDAIPLPAPKDGGNYNSTAIDANFQVMPKGCKHPAEAFKFMAWFSGYGAEQTVASILTKGGWVPTSDQIAKTDTYQKYINDKPVRKLFVDALSNPNDLAYPNVAYVNYFHDKMKNAIERILMKQQTAEESMKQLQSELDTEAAG